MTDSSRTYSGKTFVIDDPDARIRRAEDLTRFELGPGGNTDFKIIPNGRSIRIDDTRMLPAGRGDFSLFVHALDAASGTMLGWTSVGNVKGRLIGHTVAKRSPPAGATKTGANAAWEKGAFIGQITLVYLVGTNGDIAAVAEATIEPFLALAAAAAADGRSITVNSGFRTYLEQSYLYDGFKKKLAGFNRAAPPGSSNHESGIAFDLAVKPGPGNPNYEWMKKNATAHGFLRTVADEPWHWEYRPAQAATVRAAGLFYRFPGGGPPRP